MQSRRIAAKASDYRRYLIITGRCEMSVFDKKTNIKIDKELAYNEKIADTKENILLDELKKISNLYVDENKPKIEDFLPEEPQVQYSDYQSKSDEDIRNDALSQIGRYEQVNDNSYNELRKQQQQQLEASKSALSQSQLENEKQLEEALREVAIYARKRGLSNSSIREMLEEEARDKKGQSDSSARNKYIEVVDKISKNLQSISAKEADAASKAQEDYYKQIDAVANAATKEENKKKVDADKVNSAAAKQEADYQAALKSAKTKYNNAYNKYLEESKERSKQYGYEGAEKENYLKRYEAAEKFYLQLPKDEALKRIRSNMPLKNLLGQMYASLIQAVMKGE